MVYTTTIRSKRQRIVTALDIGTSKICCLIARLKPLDPGESSEALRNTLNATSTPVVRSTARYTVPIPPDPATRSSSKRFSTTSPSFIQAITLTRGRTFLG